MKKSYIHYGSNKFDKMQISPIHNQQFFSKPYGGFWASPEICEWSWKHWCESEGFHLERLEQSFKFILNENSRILEIHNAEDLLDLPHTREGYASSWVKFLDFEALAKKYDAIELFLSEDRRLYDRLYGWDCDSILIMNPEIVEEKS